MVYVAGVFCSSFGRCYKITLTAATPCLSPQGRGNKKSLLPWREKARMRGLYND